MDGMPGAQEQGAAPENDDKEGTSIELFIGKDGSMHVSMEPGDDENQETGEVPVKSIDEAVRVIKSMANDVLKGANSPDDATERKAFEQEMSQ